MQQINTILHEQLKVTREMGGTNEFVATGVYPDYLVFTLSTLKKTWRRKVSKIQSGSVKTGGVLLFNYRLIDDVCEIQLIGPNGIYNDWQAIDMAILNKD